MTRDGKSFAVLASLMCVALAGTAVCVLGVPLGPVSPYLDLLAQFAPQAAIGAALIGVLYAVMRLRVMSVLALATAVFGIVAVSPHEEITACGPGESAHRIVFLNLWNGNSQIDQTMAYLSTLNADAIVLVEMRPRFKLALNTLVNDFRYQSACPHACTALMLSRAPMTEISDQLARPGGPRSLAAAQIPFSDGTLTLVGVHLYRPWPFNPPVLQDTEARVLGTAVAGLGEPRMVLGDFNAVPWGAIVKGVAREGALTPLIGGGTWRTNLPALFRLPIDQALVGNGLACATKRVGRRVGSDHRPVIVDFAFSR